MTEGGLLLIEGRTYDADGVDTICAAIGGLNQGFQPILGQGQDTVEFALQRSLRRTLVQTIGGGTPQVLRNVIARHLGM